jgi:hypothetical protein
MTSEVITTAFQCPRMVGRLIEWLFLKTVSRIADQESDRGNRNPSLSGGNQKIELTRE